MKSSDIQREIMSALSHNVLGLDEFQLAASIGQATFRVGAELKTLQREQLVQEAGNLWRLTARGYERASTRLGCAAVGNAITRAYSPGPGGRMLTEPV